MNRIEFIDILKKTLSQELPDAIAQENVRYYDEYINSMGDEQKQEEEIARIGTPYLIAQTIIDGYKSSDQYRYTNYSQQDYAYEESSTSDTVKSSGSSKEKRNSIWHTVKRTAIIALVIVIVFLLLRFAFQLFIRIGIPILVCYFLIKLIRDSMNR